MNGGGSNLKSLESLGTSVVLSKTRLRTYKLVSLDVQGVCCCRQKRLEARIGLLTVAADFDEFRLASLKKEIPVYPAC